MERNSHIIDRILRGQFSPGRRQGASMTIRMRLGTSSLLQSMEVSGDLGGRLDGKRGRRHLLYHVYG